MRTVKTLLVLFVLGMGLLGFGLYPKADPVEYVKLCSLYGLGFFYIPGTDVCINPTTGDTREQTPGGTWRTRLPYADGKWVTDPDRECDPGRLVRVGSFRSTDFTVNAYCKLQTAPFRLRLEHGEFLTKIIMGGGFYDQRIPYRSGVNSSFTNQVVGLCVRSIDPDVIENYGDGPFNPPYGNGGLPLGCVANSRIVGMPASYSISAQGAYPQIDNGFTDNTQTAAAGPYVYGDQLVVTTDAGPGGAYLLTYPDTINNIHVPLAGTLSVSVCVEQGDMRFGH